MSYSIAPPVKPSKDTPHWMNMVIIISCVFIVLVTLAIIYMKCRKNKIAGRGKILDAHVESHTHRSDSIQGTPKQSEKRQHIQTMTSRGTDVEGQSNVYNSVMEG
jgi:hypothetical protein